MAQLAERPTPDFGSGHDLTVHEFEPHVGLCADNMETALDSLSPSLSAPPPLTLSQNKLKKKIKQINPYNTSCLPLTYPLTSVRLMYFQPHKGILSFVF